MYRTPIYHIPVKRVRVIVTESVLNYVVMGNNVVVMVCQSQKTTTHENAGKLHNYNGIPNQVFVPSLVYPHTIFMSII